MSGTRLAHMRLQSAACNLHVVRIDGARNAGLWSERRDITK